MKTGIVVFMLGVSAYAHRLDEYLQATTITLEKGRVMAQIRLTPGIAVVPVVMPLIDTNRDGVISADEQRAYADRVLSELSLGLDGDAMKLQLISTKFPERDAIQEGLGEIQIDFAADVPRERAERRLVFENRHQRPIGAYLVNCLVPRDPGLRVIAQDRNYEQSRYQLDYAQEGVRSSGGHVWIASAGILLLGRLALLWRKRRTDI